MKLNLEMLISGKKFISVIFILYYQPIGRYFRPDISYFDRKSIASVSSMVGHTISSISICSLILAPFYLNTTQIQSEICRIMNDIEVAPHRWVYLYMRSVNKKGDTNHNISP